MAADIDTQLLELRSEFIEALWKGLLMTVSVAVPFSLYRVTHTGWLPLYWIHIAVLVTVVSGFVYRKRLPASLLASILLIIMFVLGLTGLATFGFIASHASWLFVGCFVAGVVYSPRVGVYCIIGSLMCLVVYAYLFMTGRLTIELDLNAYATSPTSWAIIIAIYGVFSSAAYLAFSTLNQSVVRLLNIVAAQRAELKRLSTHDVLTGLPLMNLTQDRLNMAIASARRDGKKVALMFLDLDGFKAVNDTFGHSAGDYVLCEVAKRLSATVRAEDTVSRVGGDEFVILLRSLSDSDFAAAVAQKVIAAVSTPIIYEKHRLNVGVSIGISLFPDHAKDTSELRNLADQAMYGIKRSGKRGFGFARPD